MKYISIEDQQSHVWVPNRGVYPSNGYFEKEYDDQPINQWI